jgi:hypothetical protein
VGTIGLLLIEDVEQLTRTEIQIKSCQLSDVSYQLSLIPIKQELIVNVCPTRQQE